MGNNQSTILVTGGAGYIGSFATKALLDAGFSVVVLDSLENGHEKSVDSRAVLEIGDVKDRDNLLRIFKQYSPYAVVDFAAYLSVGESMTDPKKYFSNNVDNFITLLEAMKESGCKRIVKSSTASTYGNPLSLDDFPLKETYQENFKPQESALLEGFWDGENISGENYFDKLVEYYSDCYKDKPDLLLSTEEMTKLRIPTNVYGMTKLLDEIILDKYNKKSGICSVALRYFNVCGASPDGEMGDSKPVPTNLMTLVIYSLLGKCDLKIFGDDYPTKDGTGVRDYIHPLDLASGHVAAVNFLDDSSKAEIFNLGTGQPYSVFEVIKAVEMASQKTVSYQVMPRRSGDSAISYADSSKAKEVLDWEAKYNLGDMAESAWKWHSKYPDGYKSKG